MARSWRSTCAPHPHPALRPLADCLTAPGVAASAFLQCYTKSLVWPALFGLLATILQIADRQTSPNGNPLTGPFAIFLPMWGAFFLARWTRTERLLALRWGTEGASSEAPERREFKGEKEPIRTLDGKVTLTFGDGNATAVSRSWATRTYLKPNTFSRVASKARTTSCAVERG